MQSVLQPIRVVPCLMLLSLATWVTTAPVCHAEARAEILPIDDGNLAKLDKEEVKRKRAEADADQNFADVPSSSQCGSVAIGNNENTNQRGLNQVVPSNTTVIVTGNVYNTASCGH